MLRDTRDARDCERGLGEKERETETARNPGSWNIDRYVYMYARVCVYAPYVYVYIYYIPLARGEER